MRIKVCCGCLSGFVHGIVDAVHLRLSFLLFSFGRLDFAASTLSFLCGLLLHVENAVVASTLSAWGGFDGDDFSRFLWFALWSFSGLMNRPSFMGPSLLGKEV